MEDQIYITIAKVLHGEASEADRKELDEWLQADPANDSIYNEMKASWREADGLFDAPVFDATKAWDKVSARMQPQAIEELPKRGRTVAFTTWTKYSAALAALLIIGFLLWNPFSSDRVRIVADSGNKRIELPDHSVVTLREGSTLSYPKKFAVSVRLVGLEGEAFFEVVRNERLPFVVDAMSVQVKVLGTSFNVVCSPQTADVAVATGRVMVASKSALKQNVVLRPGKAAHFRDGTISQSSAAGTEAFWKSGELFFYDEPLAKVVAAISSAKDTAVRLHESLAPARQGQKVTVSFRGQPLEDMLTELCLITNCSWKKTSAGYVIRSR